MAKTAPWSASEIFVCPAAIAVIEPERSSTTSMATVGVSSRSSCSMRTGSICSIGVR